MSKHQFGRVCCRATTKASRSSPAPQQRVNYAGNDGIKGLVLAGFSYRLNLVAEPMRQSFTYNQGREVVAQHAETGVALQG